MAKSIKEQNTVLLVAAVIWNVGIFEYMFFGSVLDFGSWYSFITVPLIVCFLIVLNGVIDPSNKVRLVFWRWNNSLPGSRAFSQLAKEDPRIDLDSILRIEGEDILNSPEKQNYVWFKRYYKPIKNDPAVMTGHRYYLFTRDYTSLSFIFMLCLPPFGFQYSETYSMLVCYIIVMCAQYLVVRWAAVKYGERFVTTVMALSEIEET